MPTLDWIGKKAVFNHHNEVPFHLLRCDPEFSVGEASGNLLGAGRQPAGAQGTAALLRRPGEVHLHRSTL